MEGEGSRPPLRWPLFVVEGRLLALVGRRGGEHFGAKRSANSASFWALRSRRHFKMASVLVSLVPLPGDGAPSLDCCCLRNFALCCCSKVFRWAGALLGRLPPPAPGPKASGRRLA